LALVLTSAAPAVAQTPGSTPARCRTPRTTKRPPSRRSLGRAVEATQTDPTIPDILAALDCNIVATRRIRDLAENTLVLTDEQVQLIARNRTQIALSFQEIANLAPMSSRGDIRRSRR
jgi:hypothetical protein